MRLSKTGTAQTSTRKNKITLPKILNRMKELAKIVQQTNIPDKVQMYIVHHTHMKLTI